MQQPAKLICFPVKFAPLFNETQSLPSIAPGERLYTPESKSCAWRRIFCLHCEQFRARGDLQYLCFLKINQDNSRINIQKHDTQLKYGALSETTFTLDDKHRSQSTQERQTLLATLEPGFGVEQDADAHRRNMLHKAILFLRTAKRSAKRLARVYRMRGCH